MGLRGFYCWGMGDKYACIMNIMMYFLKVTWVTRIIYYRLSPVNNFTFLNSFSNTQGKLSRGHIKLNMASFSNIK